MTRVSVSSVTDTVVVTEGGSSTVVTVPQTSTITAITEGPQGPQGSATSYIHTQVLAASTWVINHNLGFQPSVEILDSGSQEIEGEIVHPSLNQTVITLNPATAGIARLT